MGDVQAFKKLPGVVEFGGETVDVGLSGVSLPCQVPKKLLGQLRKVRVHAASVAVGRSRQLVVVPVRRRVIRSVAAR